MQIDIKFAGICHSDIHQVREEWGEAIFPMVRGTRSRHRLGLGPDVTRYQVGDRVGVGCMVDSCGECEFCKDGEEQYCTKGAVMTYNGTGYDGEKTMGGYSHAGRRDRALRPRHPRGHRARRRGAAAVRRHHDLQPAEALGRRARARRSRSSAWVAWATWRSSSPAHGCRGDRALATLDKQEDAKRFGAAHHFATKDDATFTDNASTFDLIINTVSADLPMDAYMALLRPLGALVNVGLPSKPYEVAPFSVVGGSRALAGSNIGGIAQTQEMLDFCAEHHIGAEIETISADQVTRPTTAS